MSSNNNKKYNPKNLSINELTNLYKNGTISPVFIAKRELKKIAKMNPRVNPWVKKYPKELILKQAKESEERYKSGNILGKFDGVPITFKDDASNTDHKSSMGSWFLKNSIFEFGGLGKPELPKESEDVIKLFQKSGAIILGITTTPELCALETCSTYLNGVTRNPHNLRKTPGGSSGGAGALQALDIGYINMGSDMAGSIRIPSSHNGVFGFKPSFSLSKCSDDDFFPYFGSNGPLSSNFDNIILYMQELQKMKKWNLDRVNLSYENINKSIKGLKIAVSKNLDGFVDYVDKDVWQNTLKTVKYLQLLGAQVEFVEPPLKQSLELPLAQIFGRLCQLEYRSYAKNVKNYKNGKYVDLVDPHLMKFSETGAKLTGDEIGKALEQRDIFRIIMQRFMKKYDIFITPTTPIPARNTLNYKDDGYMYDYIQKKRVYLFDCHHNCGSFTIVGNITGMPALSVPSGMAKDRQFNEGDTPTGVMIHSGLDKDDLVLRVVNALQKKFKAITAKL